MKFVIHELNVGDVLEARVTEILSDSEVIMSFRGDLLRVQNQSRSRLSLGQSVFCRVKSVKPLRFELEQALPRSFKMDRII